MKILKLVALCLFASSRLASADHQQQQQPQQHNWSIEILPPSDSGKAQPEFSKPEDGASFAPGRANLAALNEPLFDGFDGTRSLLQTMASDVASTSDAVSPNNVTQFDDTRDAPVLQPPPTLASSGNSNNQVSPSSFGSRAGIQQTPGWSPSSAYEEQQAQRTQQRKTTDQPTAAAAAPTMSKANSVYPLANMFSAEQIEQLLLLSTRALAAPNNSSTSYGPQKQRRFSAHQQPDYSGRMGVQPASESYIALDAYAPKPTVVAARTQPSSLYHQPVPKFWLYPSPAPSPLPSSQQQQHQQLQARGSHPSATVVAAANGSSARRRSSSQASSSAASSYYDDAGFPTVFSGRHIMPKSLPGFDSDAADSFDAYFAHTARQMSPSSPSVASMSLEASEPRRYKSLHNGDVDSDSTAFIAAGPSPLGALIAGSEPAPIAVAARMMASGSHGLPIVYTSGYHHAPVAHHKLIATRKAHDKALVTPILAGVGAALVTFLLVSNFFLALPLFAMALGQFLNGNANLFNMFPNGNNNNNPNNMPPQPQPPNNNNGNGNGNNGNMANGRKRRRRRRSADDFALDAHTADAVLRILTAHTSSER